MDEGNNFDLLSSQDSALHSSQEILSQGTFDEVWKEYSDIALLEMIQPNFLNVDQLDSCDIVNGGNQRPNQSNENMELRGLQSNDHAAVSSVSLQTLASGVSSTVHQGTSSLPACETWPGVYDFSISFSPQQKSTKGVAWTYSKIKDKLYVGKDAPCPVNVSANTVLPNDVFIRVMALYTSPEQVSEIVSRCINHSMEESRNGLIEAEHLIRCESSTAKYHTDAINGRHSVVIPFENPPAGQKYSTYIYKFACFGSCAGGPNRRPLMLIFTLERGNQVIGRRRLDVKICACPGRDRKLDEAQCEQPETPAQQTALPGKRKVTSDCVHLQEIMDFTKNVYFPPPKKNKIAPNRDGAYTLNTEDRDCYEFLRQMKRFFELSKTMKNATSDVQQRAFHHFNQKVKSEKNDG